MKVVIITTFDHGCSHGGDIDSVYLVDGNESASAIYNDWVRFNKDIPADCTTHEVRNAFVIESQLEALADRVSSLEAFRKHIDD